MSNRIKISFQLTEEESEPYPVGIESLWCEVDGDNYTIKNAPMFLSKVAYNDVVKLTELSDKKYQISKIVERSGNSNLMLQVNSDRELIIDKLRSMECSVEGGAFKELFSVNIPKDVSWEPIGRFLDTLDEDDTIVMKFSSFNHDFYQK